MPCHVMRLVTCLSAPVAEACARIPVVASRFPKDYLIRALDDPVRFVSFNPACPTTLLLGATNYACHVNILKVRCPRLVLGEGGGGKGRYACLLVRDEGLWVWVWVLGVGCWVLGVGGGCGGGCGCEGRGGGGAGVGADPCARSMPHVVCPYGIATLRG